MNTLNQKKRVIIVGAGPAGLTAALELIKQSDIKPLILEQSSAVGGISRTVDYKGNRMDLGGHRFFSKSDWVMNWWQTILPVASAEVEGALRQDSTGDRHLLVRSRLSRIFFLRRFFDYPIRLSLNTLRGLGVLRVLSIGISYLRARFSPILVERNLEDFFINRFGRSLYETFFKSYTEKVWGVPCNAISPEWGAQRIKGLSATQALRHAIRRLVKAGSCDLKQEEVNTSLIERFLYPQLGPGQMWNEVADIVVSRGGTIRKDVTVSGVSWSEGRISSVLCREEDGTFLNIPCDALISTMPLRDLILGMQPSAPPKIQEIAQGLCYRDFLTVGLLVRRLGERPESASQNLERLLPDNWIYIQEPDVKLCRLQIFNNWSPALVRDPNTIWLGLEYMCQEGDELWSLPDSELSRFAADELAKIKFIDTESVLDYHVERVPKAYPAYFGSYDQFGYIREFSDAISNLYLIGRNGMHRYNNQDHSMLTAKLAVEALLSGNADKSEIWAVNVDDEYQEEKKPTMSHSNRMPTNLPTALANTI